MQTILGFETSCDETAVAVFTAQEGLISNVIHTQTQHAEYGGVVPEIAAREHCIKLLPLLKDSLSEGSLSLADIDAIAYTQGPGLPGALLSGAAFAQTLAWSLNKPSIGINHLEGHLLSPLMEYPSIQFPFLCLLVSGGHTLIVQVKKFGAYRILGQSVDDAIGEAFDKTAKMLGLGYPGGPALEALANTGNASRFTFPRPMTKQATLNMSFSGLKTHVQNTWHSFQMNGQSNDQLKSDIAAGFQQAVVDTLRKKLTQLLKSHPNQDLICAGGVAANAALRTMITQCCSLHSVNAFYPSLQLCTDNAAMIAYAGYLSFKEGRSSTYQFDIKPRWSLESLSLE